MPVPPDAPTIALSSTPSVAPDAAAMADARSIASSDRENFLVLSRLVPPHLRDDFAAVYAFCRHTDDLADEQPPTPEGRSTALSLLSQARAHLDDALADRPSPGLYANLAATVRRRAVPPVHFHALLDAFEQDQSQDRYDTWDQLLDYCSRSANPVGRIVLTLGGHRPSAEDPASAPLEALSDKVCTGLQLANFWQDVRSDLLDRDRVYLPFAETGLTAERLRDFATRPADPDARVPYIRALRPLVLRTQMMFEEAGTLHRRVHPSIAAPVWLFHRAGIQLLDRTERQGCTTLWGRPRIGRTARLAMLARAWWITRGGA